MTPTQAQTERAKYLRTILTHHEHTQNDLADLLGISQPAANRKLKGLRKFEVDELVIIADAYGLEVGLLLKPPRLDDVLGSRCPPATDRLLPCTYRQLGWSGRLSRSHHSHVNGRSSPRRGMARRVSGSECLRSTPVA